MKLIEDFGTYACSYKCQSIWWFPNDNALFEIHVEYHYRSIWGIIDMWKYQSLKANKTSDERKTYLDKQYYKH